MSEYAQRARSTAFYPDGNAEVNVGIMYVALKLAGEAGEVAEKVGKVLRDSNGDFHEHDLELAKELGDVLWYVTQMAYELGFTLDEIAEMNIEKLQSRKDRDKLGGSGDNR